MVTIVDDFSRYIWTYMIATKTQVPFILHNYFNMIENQYNKCVKKVRTDNGTEFVGQRSVEIFNSKEIVHKKS